MKKYLKNIFLMYSNIFSFYKKCTIINFRFILETETFPTVSREEEGRGIEKLNIWRFTNVSSNKLQNELVVCVKDEWL
jgi:hypothetical protein